MKLCLSLCRSVVVGASIVGALLFGALTLGAFGLFLAIGLIAAGVWHLHRLATRSKA